MFLLSFLSLPSLASDTSARSFDIEAKLAKMSPDAYRGGIVLVLSGGGTKGFAHVGVLKVLEEMDIPIVGIVGTSIGSVIGGLYATGIKADELHDIIMRTDIIGLLADSGRRIRSNAGDHMPIGEITGLLHTQLDKDANVTGPLGLLPAKSLLGFLNQYVGGGLTDDFTKLHIPFACVATDISTGDTVVLKDGSLASAIRASVAIPGLLDPWPIEGRLLVDGGLVANLPVEIAQELFPGYPVLAVDLAGETITKDPSAFSSYFDILVQSINVMTLDNIKANAKKADLVIYPDMDAFSILDSKGYEEIYERGITVANENKDKILSLSKSAALPPARVAQERSVERIVRSFRIKGVSERYAADIQHMYRGWIGDVYKSDVVYTAAEELMRRPDISNVDVNIHPTPGGAPNDVDIVFTAEKRPAFETSIGGYSSSMHSHRWVAFNAIARDLIKEGDSALLDLRWGNEEGGARLRYFTPMKNRGQWGFALSGNTESWDPDGIDSYDIDRYSARAMYYYDSNIGRFGLGLGAANMNKTERNEKETTWGPYFYYSRDTLDNSLTPTRGYSLTSQVWWNTNSIWVSHTKLTGYAPITDQLSMVFDLGLKTGDGRSKAYRALLGGNEELIGLARHPYAGDQAAWARVGLGYTLYSSWWGKLRGELFGAYGMVMDNWKKEKDAWEAGVALTTPGQFLNGRIFLVYSDANEFTVGFSIGTPQWWSDPLP